MSKAKATKKRASKKYTLADIKTLDGHDRQWLATLFASTKAPTMPVYEQLRKRLRVHPSVVVTGEYAYWLRQHARAITKLAGEATARDELRRQAAMLSNASIPARHPAPAVLGKALSRTATPYPEYARPSCSCREAKLLHALRACVAFIEDVPHDAQDRNARFFECRALWREAFAATGSN